MTKSIRQVIAHYLSLIDRLTDKYGNPIALRGLPSTLVIGDRSYKKSSILRYLTWIKAFYEDGSPIEEKTVKVGNVTMKLIYVDKRRVREEIERLNKKKRGRQVTSKTT